MKASPRLPDQNARKVDLNLKAMKLIGLLPKGKLAFNIFIVNVTSSHFGIC